MSQIRALETIRAELGALADRPSTALSLALIGQPGSRFAIPTPAAVIDLDAFDRNVAPGWRGFRGQGREPGWS